MRKFLVGPKGGSVSVISEAGEVVLELPLAAGIYPVARFAPFLFSGATLGLPGPLLSDCGNAETCKPDGQYESAANPHFRVSPAARQLREMRRMMQRTEALATKTAKQFEAMQRAKEHVPQLEAPASSSDAGEVPAS